jgi:putative flippase GtrA
VENAAELKAGMSRERVRAGLRRRANWEQLLKFCFVAVTNNYTWNRLWTFRQQRGHVAWQGMRFLVVSTLALGANLVVLTVLVALGLQEVLAQATAIVLVTPINFLGNKLWSFGRRT